MRPVAGNRPAVHPGQQPHRGGGHCKAGDGSGRLFLAWFTCDVERPPQDVTAMLGEPGHRWLTAQGPFIGDTATLDLNVSSGGVFDSPDPPVGPPVQDGTITIEWAGCNAALLTYDIGSLGLQGEIPLQRVVTDNVALCESLQAP